MKPHPGANGYCAPSPAAQHKCKRSMACVANAVSMSTRFHGYQAMKTPGRCALVMQRRISSSWMFMAKCWLRSGRLIVPESKMTEPDWALMVQLMKFLESHWQEPEEGIGEARGGRR